MIKSYPRFCLEEHKLQATRCCISSNTWLVLLYLIAYSQKHCCNTGLFILIMSIHKRYKHQLLLYTKCSIIGICKVLISSPFFLFSYPYLELKHKLHKEKLPIKYQPRWFSRLKRTVYHSTKNIQVTPGMICTGSMKWPTIRFITTCLQSFPHFCQYFLGDQCGWLHANGRDCTNI